MLHWLFTLCLLHASADEMYAYPVQKIPMRGVSEIKIIGVNGKLNLRGRGRQSSMNLRVSHSKNKKYEDWQLQVERQGNVLLLEVFNVAYGKAWDKQVKNAIFPQFDIDLEGPSLPVTIAWREGQLRMSDWNAKLEASFLKGSARIEGGSGNLVLQPVEADIIVNRHSGTLDLNGQSGNVLLTRGSGALKANWLSGKIRIEKWKGAATIEAQSAQLATADITGPLNVRMSAGKADIKTNGEIKVEGEGCAWDIRAEPPANVNVSSKSGEVQVHWKSGGEVFLASKSGQIEIQNSDFLSVVRREGSRVAEGKKVMRKMGQVFVRTESGRIRWRQE